MERADEGVCDLRGQGGQVGCWAGDGSAPHLLGGGDAFDRHLRCQPGSAQDAKQHQVIRRRGLAEALGGRGLSQLRCAHPQLVQEQRGLAPAHHARPERLPSSLCTRCTSPSWSDRSSGDCRSSPMPTIAMIGERTCLLPPCQAAHQNHQSDADGDAHPLHLDDSVSSRARPGGVRSWSARCSSNPCSTLVADSSKSG